jgi:GT2 family glycosyltransferase
VELALISFIVFNRNTAELLVRCLDHIFASDLEGEQQVIVVDNGSTDDSVARVSETYPKVALIEAKKNLGFAAANNRAFEIAEGDFLLLVNTDAMLERDCARTLYNLMVSRADVGMAGPQLLNSDGSLQTSYEAVPTLATELLNRSLLKRLFPSKYPGKHIRLTEPEPVDALIGAVMMIRKAALKQVGGFDENYFFFLEETDLAVRLRASEWKVMHEPRAKAVHLLGATARSHGAAARIEFYRSRYLFFRKHYGKRSASLIKAIFTANLTLNVSALGLAWLATLGRHRGVAKSFRVKRELWKWHLEGCPDGPGLPRD